MVNLYQANNEPKWDFYHESELEDRLLIYHAFHRKFHFFCSQTLTHFIKEGLDIFFCSQTLTHFIKEGLDIFFA